MPKLFISILIAMALSPGVGQCANPPSPPASMLQYDEPGTLTASIFSQERSNLCFRFKRTATRDGANLNVVREYTDTKGKLAARETVVYHENNLVSFELDDPVTGAKGSATIRRAAGNSAAATIEFQYAANFAARARPKVHTEKMSGDSVVNDMVGPFLLSHWDALMKGKVNCRYLVLSRLETVGFTFTRDSERANLVIVKMEPTSRIIAAMVSPLYFTIEKAPPHRVLEYTGRTTPKIQVNGKLKDFDALTVINWPK